MTDVVKIRKGWVIDISRGSLTGTRIYIDAAAAPDKIPELLPEIGDSWNDVSLVNLRAQNINVTYIDDSCNYLMYTVNYSSTPYPEAPSPSPSEEEGNPITVETSADFQTYNDSKEETADHWYWGTTDKRALELKIRKREVTRTYVIHRSIYSSGFSDFSKKDIELAGKINLEEFLGFPKGLVLYLGSSMSQVTDSNGNKKWNAQLKFVVKIIGGVIAEDNGWNKVYNPATNTYDFPQFNKDATKKLYDYAAFDPLLDEGGSPPATIPEIED